MKIIHLLLLVILLQACGGQELFDTVGGNPGELDLREVRSGFTQYMGNDIYNFYDSSSSSIHILGIARHRGETALWLCSTTDFGIQNNHQGSWRKIASDDVKITLRSNSGSGDMLYVVGERLDVFWASQTCKPDDRLPPPNSTVGRWFSADLNSLYVYSGAGNDVVFADSGALRGGCHIETNNGNDYVRAACKEIVAGLSNIFGRNGNDILITSDGGAGSLWGGAGLDTLANLDGSTGVNLFCGPSVDSLYSETSANSVEECESVVNQLPFAERVCNYPICRWADFLGFVR